MFFSVYLSAGLLLISVTPPTAAAQSAITISGTALKSSPVLGEFSGFTAAVVSVVTSVLPVSSVSPVISLSGMSSPELSSSTEPAGTFYEVLTFTFKRRSIIGELFSFSSGIYAVK